MHNILNADFMEFCHFILLPIEEGKCIIIISFDNLYSLLNDDMYFDFELKDLAKFNLQLSRVPQFLHGWFAEWFLLILLRCRLVIDKMLWIILNVHWQYDTITGLLLAQSSHLDVIMIVSGTRGREGWSRKVGGSLGLSRSEDYCLKPST